MFIDEFIMEKNINIKLQKFTKRIASEYKEVTPKDVAYMIYLDAKDNYQFDTSFKLTPKQYIEKSVENANQWLNLERKTIKPIDLVRYGITYLFFVSLEKK
jgi:hypothetical protein